jgi:hypothetical protein
MQRNIKTMMTNARATDRARTTTVPRWDEPSLPKEVQPVGKDETSNSSKDEGGGALVTPGSLRSLFAVGRHGAFGEKGGRNSANIERGSDVKGFTHGTVSRAVERPLRFMPETIISQNVLVWQITPVILAPKRRIWL